MHIVIVFLRLSCPKDWDPDTHSIQATAKQPIGHAVNHSTLRLSCPKDWDPVCNNNPCQTKYARYYHVPSPILSEGLWN